MTAYHGRRFLMKTELIEWFDPEKVRPVGKRDIIVHARETGCTKIISSAGLYIEEETVGRIVDEASVSGIITDWAEVPRP
jgi:hypothetical protein